MFSIRLNLLLKVFPQGVCQQIHQEDNQYQHQCCAISDGKLRFHIRTAGRDDIEVIRKRHALVEDTGRQLRQEVGGTGERMGAVSPETRPSARISPVMILGIPIGRMTCQMVWSLVAPNARLPSRMLSGMAFSASSVVRITKGRLSKPSVNEPARMLSPKSI